MTISSPHHSFDVALASTYSIDEAILIHHFQHWIMVNYRQGQDPIEGLFWTYQTLDWMTAHFPYWSVDQIRTIIKKLVKKGLLRKGNYNKVGFDHTTWYALTDQSFLKSQIDMVKSPNRSGEITAPIPDTKDKYLKMCVKEKQEKEIERMENVSTTEEEHNLLVKEHGLETTKNFYKRLSLWKKDTPRKRWKKNDYRSILRWVIDAEKESESWKKPKTSQTGSTNSNPASSERVLQELASITPEQRLKILNGSANG